MQDRGNDNWLIKYGNPDVEKEISSGDEEAGDDADWSLVSKPNITLAAIDNGLAFPFKHPDQWRACELFRSSIPNVAVTVC